jgi:hypothetical protein
LRESVFLEEKEKAAIGKSLEKPSPFYKDIRRDREERDER